MPAAFEFSKSELPGTEEMTNPGAPGRMTNFLRHVRALCPPICDRIVVNVQYCVNTAENVYGRIYP